MSYILKTNQAAYLLDPDNEDLVLKKKGKFSSVYLGYRVEDKLPVVIKKLNDPDDVQTQFRFQKESLMGFDFFGVQHTLDAWKDESGYYIIKEFIDGLSLRQMMQHKLINRPLFIAKCIIGTLDILSQFHNKGIYHCDLRPDNILILVNKRGHPDIIHPQVRLIDFGLSKHSESDFLAHRMPFSLIYSPPEQLLNYPRLVNATSDLYSLGLTLYECIAQYPPFFNDNPEMVMHLQLNTSVEEHKNIQPALLSLIHKATAKKKLRLPPAQLESEEIEKTIAEGQAQRFQSCEEFKTAVEKILPQLNESERKNFFSKLFG
ncbi:MAG: serine/threonine protein kinase [Bacteroidetes bacterium OLB10]|nr:MAG: serine/threonine protein kinase [Bacteroidetes bacterium OLB10]MBX3106939.1 serine/threonine protein kinase [Bacteroidota bacterium]MCB8930161.1 serine/threonine protein kinase [Bacteroidia bacterium]MCB0850222.1 serine/threonine protein kinase [Bacteroidota bacterium]MCW5931051.1 serine/threonine protein kinase [Bacteroidota bacterium]